MSKSNQSARRTGLGGKALCFFSHTHTEPTWTPEKKFTTVQFCVTSCNTEPASASAGFTEEAILSQLAFRGCQDGPTYVPPGQSWTRAKMVGGKRNWRDTEDVPTNSKLKAMNNSHQKNKWQTNSRMFKVRCHQHGPGGCAETRLLLGPAFKFFKMAVVMRRLPIMVATTSS